MTGRNMELEYIVKDSKRKSSFHKRKNGISKKINEITTLSGANVCAIIYDENNPRATVCPSKEEVQMVLDKFRSFPESEQRKTMVDHEGYVRQSIEKAREKLKKEKDRSKKKEMNNQIYHFIQTGEIDGNVSESDLEDLSSLIVTNIKEVDQRIEWSQAQEETGN
ncbi:agamous-like mads-box protein agl80-like [Trifolium pratense]|uniref:Agamous-like mads-box protein agl80-like n=1 Tax=Trifolium pratense TaxID=57577 RepID=A0A2K3N650_TRIPR|nr:agamous-like mads-box protein agl80-like [Trifolium pratense]